MSQRFLDTERAFIGVCRSLWVCKSPYRILVLMFKLLLLFTLDGLLDTTQTFCSFLWIVTK